MSSKHPLPERPEPKPMHETGNGRMNDETWVWVVAMCTGIMLLIIILALVK